MSCAAVSGDFALLQPTSTASVATPTQVINVRFIVRSLLCTHRAVPLSCNIAAQSVRVRRRDAVGARPSAEAYPAKSRPADDESSDCDLSLSRLNRMAFHVDYR